MGGTNIFKVLADGQRREILMMLKDGRLNAGEISEKLQITPAALSYHLKLLKGVDLISEYKEKNFIYYEINTTVFDEFIITLFLLINSLQALLIVEKGSPQILFFPEKNVSSRCFVSISSACF